MFLYACEYTKKITIIEYNLFRKYMINNKSLSLQ